MGDVGDTKGHRQHTCWPQFNKKGESCRGHQKAPAEGTGGQDTQSGFGTGCRGCWAGPRERALSLQSLGEAEAQHGQEESSPIWGRRTRRSKGSKGSEPLGERGQMPDSRCCPFVFSHGSISLPCPLRSDLGTYQLPGLKGLCVT